MAVLEARDVVKRYGGVTALNGVSFTVEPGSVHALLGENGAGKSTLVKVIVGAVRQDAGEVLLDGRSMQFGSTLDAARHGIAVVSQELNLFPDLDVIANMFMMRERLRLGVFDRARMEAQARPILAELGVDVPLRTPVGELTLADRQLIEIGKALLTDPRVLVLDEPTSALDNRSSGRLLDIMRVLRQRKVAVIFVTHILEEVMQVADKVTIMRDGHVAIAGADCASLTIDSIVDGMLGDRRALLDATVQAQRRTREALTARHADTSSDDRLVLEDVTIARTLWHVGLTAHVGEVVGLAGIVGAGHHAVLEAIAGMRPPASGTITLPGAKRNRAGIPRKHGKHAKNLGKAVQQGVALVSGDRARGVVHESPIWKNIAHVRTMSLGRDGFLLPAGRCASEHIEG
jgi:ABC-type sugar transport system ATPase subunit